MHARLDRGGAQLLTRTGLDWTHKYHPIAAALSALPAKQAYLDRDLDGKTSYSLIQMASDAGNAAALIFFLFDLLYLDGNRTRDDFSARANGGVRRTGGQALTGARSNQ
jgi:ATP-dependent DNA ligase